MSASVAAESTKTTESAASENTTTPPTEHATEMLVDEFHGKRVRKSFGTRAFWGTILGGYLVGKAMFYKVGFDDGDVDVFAADEVLYDMKEAELFKKEDASAPEPTSPNSVDQSEQQPYRELIRHKKNLKRRREESIDDDAPRRDWEVTLWGTRLYASIVDRDGLIYINELARTANGGKGEMESTGKVKVGDIIVAVQGRSVVGVSHHAASEMIQRSSRPITLRLRRPRTSQQSVLATETKKSREMTAAPPVPAAPRVVAAQAAPVKVVIVDPPQITEKSSVVQAEELPNPPTSSAEQPPTVEEANEEAVGEVAAEIVLESQPLSPPTLEERESSSTNKDPVPDAPARQMHSAPEPRVPMREPQVRPPAFTRLPASGSMPKMAAHQIVNHDLVDRPQYGLDHRVPHPMNHRHTVPMGMHQGQPIQHRQDYPYQRPSAEYGRPNQAFPQHQSMPHVDIRNPLTRFAYVGRFSSGRRQAPVPLPVLMSRSERPNGGFAYQTMPHYQVPPAAAPPMPTSRVPPPPVPALSMPAPPVHHFDYPPPSNQVTQVEARSNEPSQISIARVALPDHANLVHRPPTLQASTLQLPVQSEMQPNEARTDQQSLPPPPPHGPNAQPARSDEHEVQSEFFAKSPASPGPPISPPRVPGFNEAPFRETSFLTMDQLRFLSSVPQASLPSARTVLPALPLFLSHHDPKDLILVRITQPRLFLTLGAQGSRVVISSFVHDERGNGGEIESSGNVFVGDIVIAVGPVEVQPFMRPSDVARTVKQLHRPFDVYFQRATWDKLTGV